MNEGRDVNRGRDSGAGGSGQLLDYVGEGADSCDGDADFVAGVEREGVVGDDAGAGEEESAVGESVFAVEKFDQFRGSAF